MLANDLTEKASRYRDISYSGPSKSFPAYLRKKIDKQGNVMNTERYYSVTCHQVQRRLQEIYALVYTHSEIIQERYDHYDQIL